MTFTHEQFLDAVRKAGRDGQTFSSAAVREQLNLSTRDRRVLSRFHRQFRAFQDVAVDEIVKVGNNSYRLRTALDDSSQNSVVAGSCEPSTELAAEQLVAEETLSAAASVAETAGAEPVVAELVAEEPVVVVAAADATTAVADRQLELVMAEAAAPERVVDAEPAALGGVVSAAEVLTASEVSSTSWDEEPVFTSQTEQQPFEAASAQELAETAVVTELASVSDTAVLVAAQPSELEMQAPPSQQLGANVFDEPSSFFDEAPARFEPSLDSEVELDELAASLPVEAQPDARRSMLSLTEAAQLFDTPAPRQPVSGSRVRSWVSSPLEHAQSLLSGSWRERGQKLGRRVAGLFNRA